MIMILFAYNIPNNFVIISCERYLVEKLDSWMCVYRSYSKTFDD